MKVGAGTGLIIAGAALAVATASVADEADEGRVTHMLALEAEVPTVTVSPQPADRHFLNLPTLEFRFEVEARCHAGWQPESFTVNVADSRLSLAGTQLNNAGNPLLLRVPASQIAPVPIADFCVIEPAAEGSAGSPADGTRTAEPLIIAGAVSAHASLTCRADDTRASTTYVSRPLAVSLECGAGPRTPPSPSPGT